MLKQNHIVTVPVRSSTPVKKEDTDLTHPQKQFIFSLEHGKNKGRFPNTIQEIMFNWRRGWGHPTPWNFLDETLRAKFIQVDNR